MSPQQLACLLGLSAVLPHGLISLELETRLWGEEKSLGLFKKKNHLLEVGLTKNQETKTIQMLATVNLLCSIMHENTHEYKFIENNIWLRGSHMTSRYA
jgi:hypothetical protein